MLHEISTGTHVHNQVLASGSDLPKDASAQFAAGILYAYTKQFEVHTDYLVRCSD